MNIPRRLQKDLFLYSSGIRCYNFNIRIFAAQVRKEGDTVMSFKESFHPYAIITIFFWSLSYVFTEFALQYFSPFNLAFIRFLIASVTLLSVAVITKMKVPHTKDIPLLFASGGIGFFYYMIAFNHGQAAVTASTASVVLAIVPVVTALLARFIYHERLKIFQWIAILIEFIGVIVLTMLNGIFTVNTGIIWLISASLALSIYNLLQRKLTQTYTGLQTSAYSIFSGTLMLAVFAPASMEQLIHAPAIQFIYLAVLGIFSSAVAYLSWAKAFSRAQKTSQVSNYMFITPFLASFFGFLFAGEIPDMATLVGGGIIIAGLMIFNFGENLHRSHRLSSGSFPADR